MNITLSEQQARRLRLRAQGLAPEASRAEDVAVALRAVGAVQAQDLPAAGLSLRARSDGLAEEQVERARVEKRSVVHTWAMRGTLHLVPAEDVGWLLGLLGPIFAAASRGRRAELGLDEATTARGVELLRGLLAARGPQTRAELAEPLAAQGIPVEGQALIHLIGYAALTGVVCHGPDRRGKPAYTLLADWVRTGPPLDPPAAQAELARRYLAAYGPAAPEDFAAWSGLGRGAARAAWHAIAAELLEVQIAGQAAWMPRAHAQWLEKPAPSAGVRLLPSYDTYLLGYADRSMAVDQAHARRVHPGGGIVRAVVLADGCAIGTWRVKRSRGRIVVEVASFDERAADLQAPLAAEARDIARFLGQPAQQAECVITPALADPA